MPIHAVEERGDLVFFVMGYVDGETLRERVARAGPLSPRSALKVMQEVAWALGYAHQRGVVHRDVKPDNIMIERATDRAVVMDFGIAAHVRDAGTEEGTVIGTARYMSPEQAAGEAVDARSDLYSLGATFFFALTGRPPFEGRNLPAILAKHVAEPAPPLQAARPEVPTQVAAIVDRCLHKAPAARPQSGDEISRAVGDARGRDFRAPPLVRSFVRNAEISTMVLLAVGLAGQGVSVSEAGGVQIVSLGPGIIGSILIFQLIVVARRLLREGYAFEDIRAALLAEAKVQEEEADVIVRRRWLRRLESVWHRLWAGRFGRWFFRMAGVGIEPPARPALPSTDATELVLSRAAVDLFEDLPVSERARVREAPGVIQDLERRADRLRRAGAGEALTDTVAALENVRLALLRLKVGAGSVDDLTTQLARARAIGEEVDRRLAARREVDEALEGA